LSPIPRYRVQTGPYILSAGFRPFFLLAALLAALAVPLWLAAFARQGDLPAATLRDGFLYTGDIREFDGDGYLFIRDRKKDMAIVGGYNVYPREIDEVLFAHPDVLEVAAIGAPDAYRGEIVRAFVVARPGRQPRVEDLLAHCRENLARYKVPASIALVAALPKTAVGKIDKKALREGDGSH
jgi:long-chain acyl-CoA synthetase